MKNTIKKSSIKIIIGAGIMLGMPVSMYGVVYKAQYFIKDGKARVLVYDYHKDFIGAQKTKAEVKALKIYAQAQKKVGQECFFIVEDRDEYTGSDPEIITWFRASRQKRIQHYQAAAGSQVVPMTGIWGFTKQARPVDAAASEHLQAQNIDFRYALMSFIDAFFVDGDWQYGALKPGITKPRVLKYLHDIEQELQMAMNRLQTSNDGPLYTAFYARARLEATNALEWLRQTRTRIEGCASLDLKFFRALRKHAFEGAARLVDACIAHALYQHTNDACVVVYAGGGHCTHIAPLLRSEGYTLVHEAGRDLPAVQGYSSMDEFNKDMIENSVNLPQFFADSHAVLHKQASIAVAPVAAAPQLVPVASTVAPHAPTGSRRAVKGKAGARKSAVRKAAVRGTKRAALSRRAVRTAVKQNKRIQRSKRPAQLQQRKRTWSKRRR